MEEGICQLAQRYPENIAVKIGYDEALSHLMVAGGDVILVPSRFEPCGLTQLYGLQYGTLPLVRATGGLADTVTNSTSETIKSVLQQVLYSKKPKQMIYEVLSSMPLPCGKNNVFGRWFVITPWHRTLVGKNAAAQYEQLYLKAF